MARGDRVKLSEGALAIPAYSGLFRLIPAWFLQHFVVTGSLGESMEVPSGLFRLIPASSGLFRLFPAAARPIPAFSGSRPAYSGFFRQPPETGDMSQLA